MSDLQLWLNTYVILKDDTDYQNDAWYSDVKSAYEESQQE